MRVTRDTLKERKYMTENSNKTTLNVDEEDILRYAEKIRLNHQEDKAFEEIIVRFVNTSQDKINEQITIGKTPYSLVLAGADGNLPLTISPETIIKCMGDANEVYHGHSLSEEIMKQLPGELRVPTLILKGSHKNSLVAVTELRDEGNNIVIAAVELNSRRARQEVNRVTSAYGKNNVQQYIDRQVNKEHNLIACNKEKADKMFQSLGLQLPPEETFIGFDNSIAFSSENVKGVSEIILENILPRKENDMENIHNTVDNAPREEIIDTDLAVGLAVSGFHVYLDDTDNQLTSEKIHDYLDDYGQLKDGHTFTVPLMEVAQYGALETLCEKLDDLNDDVRADLGMSLEDHANELLENEESQFVWRNTQSEWENIRRSLLSGETEYLHSFLNEYSPFYSRAADLLEDLNDYEKSYLRARAKITLNDIAALKKIEPRKSVLNFTGEELTSTSAFAAVLNADIDKKSPFFRAENGEWRDSDEHSVPIIDVADKKSDFKSVRDDIKSQTIMRGSTVNSDTGWTIQISRNGLEDTVKYAAKHRDTTIYNVLYYIEDIVQNSVLLDTVTSEHNKDSKAFNTEFMHKMYSIFNFNGESYLAKLAVEEFPKNSADLSPMRRLYNLQDIKIEPLRHIEFRENPLARSILNGSNISIAHLFEIVKWVDKDFYLNKRKSSLTLEDKGKHSVENIPQQRDISHKTTSADLSATRGERGIVMEQKQEARFEVSSLSKIEGEGKGKAIGTLIVNGEFAVNGVKVVEGANGLYAAMPSEKQKSTGEYKDVVFPVTKEAREAINSAVLGAYEKLAASPEKTLKFDVEKPEKAVSKVYAQMHKVESDKTQTKAAGQLTIAGCLVVTDVKLNEGTNTQGQTKNFVAMPSKPNEKGGYDDIAFPITSEFHKSVDKSVIAAVNNIGRYEYKGVKYAELGENPASSAPLHPKFADKLMAELDKAEIPYQAKCGEKIVISVPAEQKQAFEGVKKQLTEKLNAKDKPKQTQEQKQTTGTRSTH